MTTTTSSSSSAAAAFDQKITTTTTTTTTPTHSLRIIQINDVYELDQLPRFKSLIDDVSSQATSVSDPIMNHHYPLDRTIVICCGDFVAPSLLSSLDEGYSMIDIMNQCGIDYVCLGNHEADISISALYDRIVHQSQFIWINSNVIPKQQQPPQSLQPQQEHTTTTTTTTHNTKETNHKLSLPYEHLPKYCEIVIPDQNDTNRHPSLDVQKVILLGLLTDDPALYRPNAFGGDITIIPIIERTQELIAQIYTSATTATDANHVHYGDDSDNNNNTVQPPLLLQRRQPLIIPMTHQSIQNDRIMAQTIGHICPIICGGHDHEIYHEQIITGIPTSTATTGSSTGNNNNSGDSGSVSGVVTYPSYDTCHIIKAGMDAHNAAIIDLRWYDDDDSSTTKKCGRPDIQVRMISTAQYEPDIIVLEQVKKHQLILQELEQAKLFRISDWIMNKNDNDNTSTPSSSSSSYPPFSTINNRIQPSSGTTAICTMIQMGMRTTCCILNAGGVRGNTTYPITEDSYFTWAHLKNEIPFSTEMCVCTIPGRVIEQMIHHSRLGSYNHEPPIAAGGYLHTCRNVQMQEIVIGGTNNIKQLRIISIGNEPFDLNKGYLTALPKQFFDGIDNHVPLLEWATQTKLSISDETCIPAKMVLVQVFAATMWLQMGQFHDIDVNHDGMISRDEIRQRLIELNDGQMEHVADLIVDNLLSICDLNEDGMISPIEMMVCQYVATDMLRHVGTRDEIRTITNIVMNVLGGESQNNIENIKITSHEDISNLVDKIRTTIDVHGDGTINRNDISEIFKGNIQRGSDLLQ